MVDEGMIRVRKGSVNPAGDTVEKDVPPVLDRVPLADTAADDDNFDGLAY